MFSISLFPSRQQQSFIAIDSSSFNARAQISTSLTFLFFQMSQASFSLRSTFQQKFMIVSQSRSSSRFSKSNILSFPTFLMPLLLSSCKTSLALNYLYLYNQCISSFLILFFLSFSYCYSNSSLRLASSASRSLAIFSISASASLTIIALLSVIFCFSCLCLSVSSSSFSLTFKKILFLSYPSCLCSEITANAVLSFSPNLISDSAT